MPRKSKSLSGSQNGNSNGAARPPFKGFVNYTPTSDDKRGFDDYLASGHDPILELDRVLDAGIKLSVSLDKTNVAAVASLYDNNPKSPSAGYVLSSRGGDAFTAIRRVIFLHLVILESDWLDAVDSTDPDAW